ncbi:hypothetical protein ACFE04_004475 [Oxalis oulophora]
MSVQEVSKAKVFLNDPATIQDAWITGKEPVVALRSKKMNKDVKDEVQMVISSQETETKLDSCSAALREECPELGPVGDLLAYVDFDVHGLVLIFQQHGRYE